MCDSWFLEIEVLFSRGLTAHLKKRVQSSTWTTYENIVIDEIFSYADLLTISSITVITYVTVR